MLKAVSLLRLYGTWKVHHTLWRVTVVPLLIIEGRGGGGEKKKEKIAFYSWTADRTLWHESLELWCVDCQKTSAFNTLGTGYAATLWHDGIRRFWLRCDSMKLHRKSGTKEPCGMCCAERHLERATWRVHRKLQALVYDILPSTTAVFIFVIGSRKLSANEQFFVAAQTVVSLLQTTQIISDVCFITDYVAYASSNKTKIV